MSEKRPFVRVPIMDVANETRLAYLFEIEYQFVWLPKRSVGKLERPATSLVKGYVDVPPWLYTSARLHEIFKDPETIPPTVLA